MKALSLRSVVPVLALAAVVAVCSAVPASAQYFGRNKVQYDTAEEEDGSA